MIGIYKIANKETGKTYIGQSNDIQRRFKEHIYKREIPIELAIAKYGADNFSFEIIEECSIEELDKKEIYYINLYNTYHGYGYNCNQGGGLAFGENNNNTLLTDKEVYDIREAYNNHERRKKVYQQYKDKISFATFESIWDGRTWKHVHYDVYTEYNKEYYSRKATNGEDSFTAVFTNQEVLELRKRYVNETAKDIYKDYSSRCRFQTLQQILWGRTYKELPIYKKKEKKWVNI